MRPEDSAAPEPAEPSNQRFVEGDMPEAERETVHGTPYGAPPAGIHPGSLFLPAFVCAVLSVVVMRTGFFSFFFLVPLGYAAAAYGGAAAALACASALLIHSGLTLGAALYYRAGLGGVGIDILYYAVLALGFTWIMAGGNRIGAARIRTVWRFIIAAIAGSLAFLFVAFAGGKNSAFAALVSSQAEALSSLYISASGADAVQRSYMERQLTPERITALLTGAALRGCALVSAFFLFFISRQIALVGAWLFRKRRPARSLLGFHAPAFAIWVLSLSLVCILLARLAKAQIPEIGAWNVLTLCVMLYLAQGMGIVHFTLIRRPMPPMLRFLLNILIIAVILSPGLNAVALAGLALLGIAENWLPLRVVKTNGVVQN
jgi:hypothetical protein